MNPDRPDDSSAQMSSFETELDIVNCQAIILKSLRFFQSIEASDQRVRIVEDWTDHDGLEFDKGTKPLGFLFSLASSPRTLFEGTPKDDDVYIRASAESGMWSLRFRTNWDDDGRVLMGRVQIHIHQELCSRFEDEMSSVIHYGDLRRVEENGEPSATDNPDDAHRLREDH